MKATVDAPSPAAEAPDEGRPQGDRRLVRGLVIGGAGISLLLLVAGLAIQQLLPEPYPLLASQRLPRAITRSTPLMTDNGRPADNQPLIWAKGRGHRVDLGEYTPGDPVSETKHLARITIPQSFEHVSLDVGYWPPWRALALYSYELRPKNVSITVSPTWTPEARPVNFVAPLVEPPKGTTREFTIGTWGGRKPDLFVLTRGDPESRPVLQILSGESGFHSQVSADRLPYRGLSPATWSAEIAPIVGLPKKSKERDFKGQRLDLVLIHHDPTEEHSVVHVLLGEAAFQWDAMRRDLDDSGSVPPGTDFLIGSHQGATAIYEVQDQGSPAHLKIFGLTNPPALQ
jgi:hypothetical protein